MKGLPACALVAFHLALLAAGAAPAAEPDPIVAQATGESTYVLAEFISKTCAACDQVRPVVASVLEDHPEVRFNDVGMRTREELEEILGGAGVR